MRFEAQFKCTILGKMSREIQSLFPPNSGAVGLLQGCAGEATGSWKQ